MKYLYGLTLLAALILACTVGETKGVHTDPDCPQAVWGYVGVVCE